MMRRNVENVLFSLFVFVFHIFGAVIGEESMGHIIVEHSLDAGTIPRYSARGIIPTRSFKGDSETFSVDIPFSDGDKSKLMELVENNGLYRLRVTTNTEEPRNYVSTFVKACALYESMLSHTILLNVDLSGEVFGISVVTPQQHCHGYEVSTSLLDQMTTTVEVHHVEPGPGPETTMYIQKLEKEKADKAKGDMGDNRSFISKYWMYILAAVIFLLISGAANPEGQGGGR